jgi:integrase/recombinase XerD
MRTPSLKAKSVESEELIVIADEFENNSEESTAKVSDLTVAETEGLKDLITATVKLWRKHHLSYDQTRYVAKEARRALGINRVKTRKKVVQRLSREEEERLIRQAYKDKSEHGLLIKTLLMTGARVSEFAALRVEDLYFDECTVLIQKGKGGKSRYVPILPELAQELRTHLGRRQNGFLFESNRHSAFSARRIQQIIKSAAENAGITKNVYPHLLRHTVATFLLERGMPLEQIQKFLGHSKIETTQIYAESSAEMLKDSYRKALLH